VVGLFRRESRDQEWRVEEDFKCCRRRSAGEVVGKANPFGRPAIVGLRGS
jgi:hypothetical protein